MNISLLLYYTGLLLFATASSSISNRYIYVNLLHGLDVSECRMSDSANVSCQSLDYALDISGRADGTHYVLSQGVHYLQNSVATFENLNDLSFIGSGDSYHDTIISCNTTESGLAFHNVTRILFSNVTVFNCSSLRNSTSKNFHTFVNNGTYTVYLFPVALYFYSCLNVTFDRIKVDRSPNGTGVVMYDTFGMNTVSNSVFSNNNGENHPHPGGGGFYVEFTYCIPGDENCWKHQHDVKSYFSNNTKSQYLFRNCLFANNNATNSDIDIHNSTYIVPYRADHVAFGRGGGLSIFVKGDANNNLFTVSNCTFHNNSALWGAGLFVEFHDDTFENKAQVLDSRFTNNYCYFTIESGTAGGGMRIGHYVYGNTINGQGNDINITNCHFDSNAALDGGGLSISPTVQDVRPDQVATVHIIGSTFKNNYGKLGAAIHIDRFVMILRGLMLNVNIKNCTLDNNSIKYTNYIRDHFHKIHLAFQTGAGAVYVNQVPVAFISQVHFSSNYGSAIAAVGTGLNFSDCISHFKNNKGNSGGAIALLGAAYLMVNDRTSLIFDNNEATLYGGAIYNEHIERENLYSYPNCFIRHTNYFLRPEQWKAFFFFYNNTDQGKKRPSAIYTTSILPCSWAGGSGISRDIHAIFCWNVSKWIYYPTNCTQQIFSDVGEIASQGSELQVEAFPGIQFTLPFTTRDDLNTKVGNQTVFSAIEDSNRLVAYFWDEKATLYTDENVSIPLQLDTLGDRIWEININVELQPCPPGFKFNDDYKQCECAGHYIRALNCTADSRSLKAYLRENNWIGKIPENDTYYFVSFCPPNYCSSGWLPNKSSEVETVVCGPQNRKGILCGECNNSFGVAVNLPTFDCINCSSNYIGTNIAKYIAAVYIPLIALFTAIILFNIRLTSGPANAFILYSQVIASTFDLDADGQISISRISNTTEHNLEQAYRVIYGIFNLQFVERFISPLCLGFSNTLNVLMLEYAVAFSPLVMIVIVLCAFKLKECCAARCPRSRQGIRSVPSAQSISSGILPAFAAFLLLSYMKFSTISSYILLSQPLFDEYGNEVGLFRVYYAGQYTTNDSDYKKYMITACVVYAIFVAIPPLILIDFPRKIFEWIISKIDCVWRYYPSDKIQIFLDTFQGCYKNKMRFFSGLYFVFRLVINVSYVVTHNWFDQYLIQQIACCVLVALLAVCQPYNDKYKIFNTIDILIFTNLGIINALTSYLLSQSDPLQGSVPTFPFVIQYILLFLPLVYMLVYVAWSLVSPCKQSILQLLLGAIHKIKVGNHRPLQSLVANLTTQQSDAQQDRDESSDEFEGLLQRAQTSNTYRPFTQSVVEIDTNGDSTYGQTRDSAQQPAAQANPTSDYGSNGSSRRSSSMDKQETTTYNSRHSQN